MLGFMGSKVLGQFDPFHEAPGEHGRLLLVAPNVVHIERELAVDPHDFRLWVCLHEETHRVQFTAVPWMADHLRSQMELVASGIKGDPTQLVGDLTHKVVDLFTGKTDGSLIDLMTTPEQKQVIDQITGVMSLLEGHADVVMDGVGPEVIPTVASIRNRFTRRRQGVGTLATEVLSGCEPALPLVASPTVALLPRNISAFAEGLDLDGGEVMLHVAAREAARARLFHAAPWLGPHLLAAVRDYAAGIVIDTDAIEAGLAGVDPSDPEAMRSALEGRLFAPPARTSAQQRALTRLESTLALVEGWVDVVASAAVAGHLPHAEALGEAVRRRRAGGGPAERTFGALVGLELRPRRLRDAVNLFAALEAAGGAGPNPVQQPGQGPAGRHPVGNGYLDLRLVLHRRLPAAAWKRRLVLQAYTGRRHPQGRLV